MTRRRSTSSCGGTRRSYTACAAACSATPTTRSTRRKRRCSRSRARSTSFDGRSRFTTWCYRVATNAALDEVRRRNRRPQPVESLPEAAGDGARVDNLVVDRLVVDAALAQLGPEYRAAVALRDLIGMDYAEIGEVLGVPPGTVRSRISRGRAALADLLGNQTTPLGPSKPRAP